MVTGSNKIAKLVKVGPKYTNQYLQCTLKLDFLRKYMYTLNF